MKRLIIIVLLLIITPLTTLADEVSIKFHFKLGFLKGGEAILTIKDTTFNGKAAINYRAVGRTTGLANALYSVYDIYETTVDAETLLPLKSIRNVKEGSYKRYNEALFFHDIDSIHTTRSGWKKMPDNCVDILSVFFYFIEHNDPGKMHSGDAVILPTYNADKINMVAVKFLREKRINTSVGKIDTYVLNPSVISKFLDKHDGIKCYMSKKNKMIVYADLDLTFGSLKAVLKSYKINGVEQKFK